MWRSCGVAILGLLLGLWGFRWGRALWSGEEPLPAGPDTYAPGVQVGSLDDARITESSGLVASRRNPEVFWTHNDSGDGPRVYAFDRPGHLLAVCTVSGAEARDWEDLAVGPGPQAGASYLYIGDIGDNGRRRKNILVYRVPEPTIDPQQTGVVRATTPAEELVFRYPDGPHDAEALLVHPTRGALYIVVKEGDPSGVYRAVPPFHPGEAQTLEQVGAVAVVAATGGEIAPDGQRAALCNYLQAYEYLLPEGSPFEDLWATSPRIIPMPPMRQREALAYRADGGALLATSEGRPMPLFELVGQSPASPNP